MNPNDHLSNDTFLRQWIRKDPTLRAQLDAQTETQRFASDTPHSADTVAFHQERIQRAHEEHVPPFELDDPRYLLAQAVHAASAGLTQPVTLAYKGGFAGAVTDEAALRASHVAMDLNPAEAQTIIAEVASALIGEDISFVYEQDFADFQIGVDVTFRGLEPDSSTVIIDFRPDPKIVR